MGESLGGETGVGATASRHVRVYEVSAAPADTGSETAPAAVARPAVSGIVPAMPTLPERFGEAAGNAGLRPAPLRAPLDDWSGPAVRLAPGDLTGAAAALGVPPAALTAVLAVEASGRGFDDRGRPVVLREGHVFWRQLRAHRPDKLALAEAAGLAWPRWDRARYQRGQDAQFAWLNAACAVDRECALRACSWGLGQVLGENHAAAGFASAAAMVAAFRASEQHQLAGMLRCIRAWGLVPAMVAQDWPRFARRYNGPGQVAAYSVKLAAAHRHACAALPATSAPTQPPHASRVRVHPADGATDALNDRELARIRGGI